MAAKPSRKLKVVTAGSRCFIDIHPQQGESLARYLRSQGVICSPPEPSSKEVDSIELPRGANVKAIQALLNGWEAA
jgi:hypothetical protein